MAIYHASMKIIGRQVKKGGKVVPGRHNSAVAAAAYQGGLKLRDERNEKTEDYSRKGGVAFTTVLTPERRSGMDGKSGKALECSRGQRG